MNTILKLSLKNNIHLLNQKPAIEFVYLTKNPIPKLSDSEIIRPITKDNLGDLVVDSNFKQYAISGPDKFGSLESILFGIYSLERSKEIFLGLQGETRPSPHHRHTEKIKSESRQTKKNGTVVRRGRCDTAEAEERCRTRQCSGAEAVAWRNSLVIISLLFKIGSSKAK